ncbi:Speckle-type POZ protein [Araneus ventricosus]|uniref:Speckle-type POZ protein n=1 Tax=Araneus ventricosus TaxID=182803 RepID=A0A4Y2SNB5_ARAVE|nr:Speckle-type POZ protein [Araneus ventricosus]
MAGQIYTKRKAFAFTWIIENFEYCEQKTGNFLKSPTFIVDTIDRSKWSLSIYPRGDTAKSWISLFLEREEDSKGPVTIEVGYELAFLTVDGSVLTSQSEYKHAFLKNDSDGFSNFEERESVFSKRSKFLPHDALTIRCRMWKRTGEVKTDGQCVARTRIGVERKAFLWKIPNFSSLDEENEETYSLTSTSADKPIVSLTFFCTDDPDCLENPYMIEINNFNSSIVFATFKSSLVDAEGNYVNSAEDEVWPSPNLTLICCLSQSKDILMDKNYLYLPHNTLTLYCELAFSTGTAFEGIEGTVYGCSPSFITNNLIPEYIKTADIKKSVSDLKVDIGSMLRDNILCDVKLSAESETFPAHRFILSARSPVFRAMFQSDMKEKVQDRIVIKDLKPDTVFRMLHFMYTDSLELLLWQTASDLYVAAVKYQIMTLKDKCSSFLKSSLSLSNACEILLLSDLYKDEELKSTVQGFILKNDKSIINSSAWKEVMKINLHLAAETMLLKFKE